MKPSELAQAILVLAGARQPFMIWGDPGVGKSQVVEQVSDQLFAALRYGNPRGTSVKKVHGLPKPGQKRGWLVDLRAVLLDPVDLMGIPVVQNGLTCWAAPRVLPQKGSGLLFFDELNRAPVMVQNACLQLVLDRRLGEYELPKDWIVGAAGNFESETGVQRMPDALRSRFTHLRLEPDLADWCEYAASRDFHPAVVAFIRWRPELLHKYDKVTARKENAFPCPRTWEFVSRICAGTVPKSVEFGLIEGTVGKAAAGEFVAFLQMYRDLPDMAVIVREPDRAPLPTKPATAYAIASALARMASNGNVGSIITYLDRMPEQEYAVLAVKEMVARDPKLERVGAITRWKVDHADVIF
jgi:MoxR-like ATPase